MRGRKSCEEGGKHEPMVKNCVICDDKTDIYCFQGCHFHICDNR